MINNIKKIKALLGKVTKEQLRYVDCYLGGNLGLFIPSVGPCFFAMTPLHSHPAYLFILAFDENCSLKIKGKIVRPVHGKICVISAGLAHHELMQDDFSRYIAVVIKKGFFEKQFKIYSNKHRPDFTGELFAMPPDLMFYIKDFMLEYENKMPGYKDLLKALSFKITHALIRDVLDIKPVTQRSSFRIKINNAIDYMYANYANKITVEDMAYNAVMSVSHFSRLFKQETGKAPNDYLIYLRLTQSQKLLRAADKPLTQIAHECGFASSAYFSACFLQRFKITPSEYRKKFAIKQNS
ncbi:MAG: helix-turn-helix transcriptional regulator [Candidatus Omnitrophota bacterium]